jgi:hypothetical protein
LPKALFRMACTEETPRPGPPAAHARRPSMACCRAWICSDRDSPPIQGEEPGWPAPLLRSLAGLTDEGGIVSVMVSYRHRPACRPALAGDWAQALSAFDAAGSSMIWSGVPSRHPGCI